jgi:hypothetical protein
VGEFSSIITVSFGRWAGFWMVENEVFACFALLCCCFRVNLDLFADFVSDMSGRRHNSRKCTFRRFGV